MIGATENDSISTLNGLIQISKDGEQGFRKAAEATSRQDLKALFVEYAQQRLGFAGELQALVAQLGADPDRGGSVGGAVHRTWIDVKSAVTKNDDHAVLAEVERGEDTAVDAYSRALQAGFSGEIASVVERQYQLLQQAHRNIRNLRNTVGTPAESIQGGPQGGQSRF